MELSTKLDRLAELSRQATSSPHSGRLMEQVIAMVQEVFSCRSVAMLLLAEDTEFLTVKASGGLSDA